jgi:hypothetical protein
MLMTTSKTLAGIALVTSIILGTLAPAAQGQEMVRGISLFPDRETTGVVPKVEVLRYPEPVYPAAAVGATLVSFPFKEGWCAFGEFSGFIVGTVVRSMVWAATFGDQFGAGRTLEQTGNGMIERTCAYPLYVTADDFKRAERLEEATR